MFCQSQQNSCFCFDSEIANWAQLVPSRKNDVDLLKTMWFPVEICLMVAQFITSQSAVQMQPPTLASFIHVTLGIYFAKHDSPEQCEPPALKVLSFRINRTRQRQSHLENEAKRSMRPATEPALNYNLFDWLLTTRRPQETVANY